MDFKQSLNKGFTAFNVKAGNLIEESKCKTYIATLEKDIADLKQLIGETIYVKWTNGEDAAVEVTEILEKIKGKEAEIQAQKARIEQLSQEEQQILGTQKAEPAVKTPAPEAAPADFVFCSQCGTRNAANYRFCAKCGNPIK